MMIRLIGWLVGMSILLLGSLGCIRQDAKQEAMSHPTVLAGQDRQYDARLLEIAGSYKNYERIGDYLNIPIAPCAFAPPNQFKAKPSHYSASPDSSTHGRKLYWLFVKDKPPDSPDGDYVVAKKLNPVGEVVVKEAWVAEEVKDGQTTTGTKEKPLVHHDGRVYRQGELAGLFIMYKLDPKTPGTDEGWVYGTVTADGKTVTAAGRVASCMSCHTNAPNDRLLGVVKK